MNRIIQFVKENDLVKFAIIGVLLYLFVNFNKQEGLEATPAVDMDAMATFEQTPQEAQQAQIDSIVAGKDQLNVEDLLPKYDEENAFAKENPVSKLLKEKNYLISGHHQGITTSVSSHKMAYHDIRALPYVIQKENVGPWAQSSYDQPAGADIRPILY